MSFSITAERATAPQARTLLDIFHATAARCGDRIAIDAADARLTYGELSEVASGLAGRLSALGVGQGDRVGVQVQSGTSELYAAILGVLQSGAAYVPVDFDDPPGRAADLFERSSACAVVRGGLAIDPLATACGEHRDLAADDDAWVIFTSGSTGAPKAVAVSHRSAAAFVDSEARLWSITPEDRVLAGLSVGFDASCEEIWLAWRHGAALVPAPRAIVRAGSELGPWLAQHGVSVISTVPTLAAMWDERSLAGVKLLIFGGEACPDQLAWRLAGRREVWNTYGPTEATVVSTAARVKPGEPVTIGWPLDGWETAVVDEDGEPVAPGEPGELVIAGAGVARYLDPLLDTERFPPVPSLGWERAYPTGDIVRESSAGIVFIGRRDHQVKIGGRRIELGEIDAQLTALPAVEGAVTVVRESSAGNKLLVGYVVGDVDPTKVRAALAERLPQALVPFVVTLDELPKAASGKVDRGALPWPLPAADPQTSTAGLDGIAGWLAKRWADQLGPVEITLHSDFFELGGSSLAAAKLVSVLRGRFPSVAVADVYSHRRVGELAARLQELGEAAGADAEVIARRPLRFGAFQLLGVLALFAITSSQWIIGALAYGDIVRGPLPQVSWGWLVAAWLVLSSPPGRTAIVLLAKRTLLGDLRPGRYSRYSWLACRVWFVERLAEVCRTGRLAGTPWADRYARRLGANVGAGAHLGSVPQPTSLVHIGAGATLEGNVDMHGWWVDGQELVIGEVRVGAGASIGGRTLLMGGAVIGDRAEIEPGSVVIGVVPAGERWAGNPARHVGTAGEGWPSTAPPRNPHWRMWRRMFGVSLAVEGLIVVLAFAPAGLVLSALRAPDPTLRTPIALLLGEAATIAALSTLTFALLVAVTLRLVWRLVRPGWHGETGSLAWALWFSEDLKQGAGAALFPLYASIYTRSWLRLAGMSVGRRSEISTSTGLNPLVSFGELAQATDDVGFCTARARDGWLHLAPIEIGSRTFVGPGAVLLEGTRIGDDCLVGVLTAAPRQAGNGTSWFGAPPLELPRVPDVSDPARTTNPPARLILARAAMDLVRIVLPNALSVLIAILVLLVLDAIGSHLGIAAMVATGPLVVFGGALLATALAVLAKWIVIGRYQPSEHPLWSLYVWRDELINSMHEQLAGEWLLSHALGTPLMPLYLRAMGARVGRGVWFDTMAVTEYDVVELGDNAAINRGACVMTHLFHDRLLRIGPTNVGTGATLGPSAAILPDTRIGASTCIGPHSVVLRGEELPAATRWHGAPVVSM